MNGNQFQGRVDDIAYKQGWSEETLLELALQYISDLPDRHQEAFLDFLEEVRDRETQDSLPDDASEPDDSMDGDHESALASAGFGTDESYGGGFEPGDLD